MSLRFKKGDVVTMKSLDSIKNYITLQGYEFSMSGDLLTTDFRGEVVINREMLDSDNSILTILGPYSGDFDYDYSCDICGLVFGYSDWMFE